MMKKDSSVRHLKLITGEEVICEVLDEDSEHIVVNNAMSLMQNTLKNGEKFFTFKTYMIYQDTPTNVMLIFTDKIMSLAIPVKEMVEQYRTALDEMAKYLEDNYSEVLLKDDFHEDDKSLEDWLEEMNKEDGIDSDVDGMLMN
jgi:hypothetical protein